MSIDSPSIKYKIELDAVNKYINNSYIYDVFYRYGFIINNKFIKLDSNINVYESCFIAQLIHIYISNLNKKNKKSNSLNILEIGFAYGTSTLVLLNELIKYSGNKSYDIIDPNQSSQWNNIGMKNIKQFLHFMNTHIHIKLYEKYSSDCIPTLKKLYDIIFIDGSHDYNIVIQDIINSDKKLKLYGLIILDDVLHDGVKKAIFQFLTKYKNYVRISVNNNKYIREKFIYDKKSLKRSFSNPNSMFCFFKNSI